MLTGDITSFKQINTNILHISPTYEELVYTVEIRNGS